MALSRLQTSSSLGFRNKQMLPLQLCSERRRDADIFPETLGLHLILFSRDAIFIPLQVFAYRLSRPWMLGLFLLSFLFVSSVFEYPFILSHPLVFRKIDFLLSSHALMAARTGLLSASLLLQSVISCMLGWITKKHKTKLYKIMPPWGFETELLEEFVTSVQI